MRASELQKLARVVTQWKQNIQCKIKWREGVEVIGGVKDNVDWCFRLVPSSKNKGAANQSMNFDSCFIVRVVTFNSFVNCI